MLKVLKCSTLFNGNGVYIYSGFIKVRNLNIVWQKVKECLVVVHCIAPVSVSQKIFPSKQSQGNWRFANSKLGWHSGVGVPRLPTRVTINVGKEA